LKSEKKEKNQSTRETRYVEFEVGGTKFGTLLPDTHAIVRKDQLEEFTAAARFANARLIEVNAGLHRHPDWQLYKKSVEDALTLLARAKVDLL
jgi:hypothetical protein